MCGSLVVCGLGTLAFVLCVALLFIYVIVLWTFAGLVCYLCALFQPWFLVIV